MAALSGNFTTQCVLTVGSDAPVFMFKRLAYDNNDTTNDTPSLVTGLSIGCSNVASAARLINGTLTFTIITGHFGIPENKTNVVVIPPNIVFSSLITVNANVAFVAAMVASTDTTDNGALINVAVNAIATEF